MGLAFREPSFAGRIGVAREDITPPDGIYARNWGAARHDTATGIHRPLTATAIALISSQTEVGAGEPVSGQAGNFRVRSHDSRLATYDSSPPLVLIAADLGWWRTPQDEWYIRGAVLDALDLEPDRLLLCLSHTHSGPSLCRDDEERPGGHLVLDYLEWLREALADVARWALEAAEPATLTWGADVCSLAQNRDLPDPAGGRFLCGYGSGCPADQTLLVGRVTAEDGTPAATLVNYACHPTTLAWQNRLISPDFVGAMRDVVEEHADGAPCLFLQGASGELAPREGYVKDPAVADAHGRSLGFAAVSALEEMLPPGTGLAYRGVQESGAPLARWEQVPAEPPKVLDARMIEVDLPIKPLPSLPELDAQMAASTDRWHRERLVRNRQVRRSVGDGESLSLPIWIWRVGDAVFIGVPGEAYSRLQVELRAAFPDQAIICMNVANGWYGYLPPAELYGEDLYAVWQTPFAQGSLERVIEACRNAICEVIG